MLGIFYLDSLTNFVTAGDCGMPMGPAMTKLEAGSTFNVTWLMSYPHRGNNQFTRNTRYYYIFYWHKVDLSLICMT